MGKVIWITGQSKAGKSTLAWWFKENLVNSVVLDGDEMRASVSADLDFSKEGRMENNLRIARLARTLTKQGFNVIVATICPYAELRQEVQKICSCHFIELEGGITYKGYETYL